MLDTYRLPCGKFVVPYRPRGDEESEDDYHADIYAHLEARKETWKKMIGDENVK